MCMFFKLPKFQKISLRGLKCFNQKVHSAKNVAAQCCSPISQHLVFVGLPAVEGVKMDKKSSKCPNFNQVGICHDLILQNPKWPKFSKILGAVKLCGEQLLQMEL